MNTPQNPRLAALLILVATAFIAGTTLASFCVEGFSTSRSGRLQKAEIARRCAALREMSRVDPIRL